jgi:multiple sugar transport system substrate-binding protein
MSESALNRRQFVTRAGVLGLAGALAPGALLEACGGSPQAAPTAGGSSGAIESVGPISILINDSPWLPGLQALVKLYQQRSGNQVTLNVTPFSGMLAKSRNAVQASASEFDILNLNEQWYMPFYAANQVVPIREIEPGFQLDPQVIQYDYATRWDSRLKYSTKDGELYGLPINGNIQLYYYRSDLLKQAGMAVPKTWEQVDAFARHVTRKPDMYGWADRTNPSDFEYQSWLESYGGYLIQQDSRSGAWSIGIGTPQAQEATNTWVNLGRTYGPANFASLDYPSILGLMGAGKLAQSILVCASSAPLSNPQSSAVVGKIGVAVNPGTASRRATMSGIWVMGIPRNLPKDRQRAGLTFLKWALTKEAQIAYTHAGAVPVREDVYRELSSDPTNGWWLKAMADSTPYIKGQPRLPETPQIITALDLGLADIVSGRQSIRDGLNQVATQFRSILTQGGYRIA